MTSLLSCDSKMVAVQSRGDSGQVDCTGRLHPQVDSLVSGVGLRRRVSW